MTDDTLFRQFPIEPGDGDETDDDHLPAEATFKNPGDGRLWRDWWEPFLTTLALTANVSQSARQAGISVTMANRDRRQHEHFTLLWHDATVQAADLLRQVGRKAAIEGDDVTTVREEFDSEGKLVARIITTKKVRDNAMLARFLVAYCSEFREQRKVTVGGPDGEPIKVELDTKRTPERLGELLDAMIEAGLIPESLPPEPDPE